MSGTELMQPAVEPPSVLTRLVQIAVQPAPVRTPGFNDDVRPQRASKSQLIRMGLAQVVNDARASGAPWPAPQGRDPASHARYALAVTVEADPRRDAGRPIPRPNLRAQHPG